MTEQNIIALEIGGKTKKSRFAVKAVSLDWNSLPDASQAFVIRYGLKQYLQDAMAGAESEAEAHTGVDDRVAKLVSGDLARTKGEGVRRPDTVESRTMALARDFIRKALKDANATADKDTVNEAAKALAEGDPSFKKLAEKQLAEEKTVKEGGNDAAKSIIAGLLAKKTT